MAPLASCNCRLTTVRNRQTPHIKLQVIFFLIYFDEILGMPLRLSQFNIKMSLKKHLRGLTHFKVSKLCLMQLMSEN